MPNGHTSINETARTQPPKPEGLPVAGNLFGLARDGLDFLTQSAREHGDLVRVQTGIGARMGFEHVYLSTHPEDVRHVLVENNQNYVKGKLYDFEITGEGLVSSEGDLWRRQRHLVNPAFHPDRIAVYSEMMTAYTERLCETWNEGETVDIRQQMGRLTLEIISKALFDVDIRNRGFEQAWHDATQQLYGVVAQYGPPEWLPAPGKRRYQRAEKERFRVVDDVIDERRHSTDGTNDVVSMLVAAGGDDGGMSDKQLRDEVLTLLLAGHDTTALALTGAWYLLARHPEVKAQLLEEFRGVLGGRTPTMADLNELEYTEKVIKESMRLYPPVPYVLRESVEDDELGGYRIPAGSTIVLSQWVVHRDSRWYDDPLAFKPERWTDEFEQSMPPLAYFPFAAGPRRCLGDRFAMLETQLVLATIAQQYHLELVAGDPLELTWTSRLKKPIEMVIQQRTE